MATGRFLVFRKRHILPLSGRLANLRKITAENNKDLRIEITSGEA
jgi:hypothetical protein